LSLKTRFWFYFFEVVIGYLTLLWFLVTAAVVVWGGLKLLRGRQEGERHSSLMNLASEISQCRQLQMRLDVVKGHVRHVQPATYKGMAVELCFFLLDVITDFKQIHDLHQDGQFFLGGLMTCVFASSMTLLANDARALRREVIESVRTGVLTEGYLRIMNLEKGFESAVSLTASAYTCRFAISSADSCLNNVLNILVSTYSLATFLFRRVILLRQFNQGYTVRCDLE